MSEDRIISQPLHRYADVCRGQCPVYVERDGFRLFCTYELNHKGQHSWDERITEDRREAVNHPQHYGGDVIYEAIKVIAAWELNFQLGSVLKYICRCGKKAGADELEDLKKARFYLDWEIKRMESNK